MSLGSTSTSTSTSTSASTSASVSVWAVGPYEDGLRTAVLAFKERGRRDLGEPLAGLLTVAAEAAIGAEAATVALVPIPSSRAAIRARGGAHVERLARLVSRQLGHPVAPHALRLVRATRDSAGLGIDARQANLTGAMASARPPGGYGALVLDDVVTTGATLAEGMRALADAGWPIVGAAVIAATPRRFPSSR